jgi:hydrogenase maturation protease
MNLVQKQASSNIEPGITGADIRSPGISTVIVGLGHPFRGDDGVGNAVIENLARTQGLPQNINLLEGGTSALFDAILGNLYERVILIDAAEIGRQPGEWICLDAERLVWTPDAKNNSCDSHRLNLGDLMALGQLFNVLPKATLIYAVQPLSLEWTNQLSKPVREAVSEIAESILRDIWFESIEHRNLVKENASARTCRSS